MINDNGKQCLDMSEFRSILTNPFFELAARFWDPDRYQAFQVCYRSMREIDDLVDNARTEHGAVPQNEVFRLRSTLFERITDLRNGVVKDDRSRDLFDAFERYRIPLWPWERLATAMEHDLTRNGFDTFRDFLRYSEGTAIAPAAVFAHLCGLKRDGDSFAAPSFDIRRAVRPLALFATLTHILRDLREDQRSGLNRFSDEIMAKHSLYVSDLGRIARGGTVAGGYAPFISQHLAIADRYRSLARGALDAVLPRITPQYALSLEVVLGLYSLIYERLTPDTIAAAGPELTPTPAEITARIQQVVSEFQPPRA